MFELKKTTIAFAISSLLVMSSQSFAAYRVPASSMPEPESTNWYLQGFSGVSLMMRNTLKNAMDLTYKPGWDVGVAVGYRSGPFRYELQYTYIRSRWDQLNHSAITSDVNSKFTTMHVPMLNGYYDFTQLSSDYTPYIGAGIGAAMVKTPNGTIVTNQQLKDTVFAWQGIVGLSYRWDNEWRRDIRYRYLDARQPATQFTKDLKTNLIEFGVSYYA